MSPLISIIIVVYNGATKIRSALDTILKQTFQDFEIVVIDGGSTDGTIDVLESFSDNISFWCSEPDKGIYDAMNKGVRNAKGNWVYFLGCDDELYDNSALATAANVLKTKVPDLLYGNVLMNNSVYDGEFNYDKLLKKNISHQAIFYKKDIFEKVGTYNLCYKSHADWDFNIRCFAYPGLNIEYQNFMVAKFGVGGISAAHDIPFVRRVLIPLTNMQLKERPEMIANILYYDHLWRMIRNAEIRNKNELVTVLKNDSIHHVFSRIVHLQSYLPIWMLKRGFLSKPLMAISFLLSKFI